MKRSINLSSLIAIILLFYSCGEVEVPNKFFELDEERIELSVGKIDDWGTDNDISYRTYRLGFADFTDNPENYISFRILSYSTTRIEEGTYTYQFLPEEGEITSIQVGVDLAYDSSGEAIAGTRFSESNSEFDGTITVSKKNDNYCFVFDIIITRDDETYSLTGEYNDVLSEGYFNF